MGIGQAQKSLDRNNINSEKTNGKKINKFREKTK